MSVIAELDPQNEDKIIITAPYLKKDLIKNLPGSSFKGNQWRVPLSWPMCLALRGTFKDELTIGENLQAWAFTIKTNKIDPALALRDQVSAEGYPDLYPYQRAGVKFLATAERALLCDGLGSGKSRTTFSTVKYLYEQGHNPFPILIVAPNSTKVGWSREVEAVWPGLKVNVIAGTAAKRRKLLLEPAHVYVINWEALRTHSRLAPFGSISLKRCEACGGADGAVKETACQVHERELNKIDFNTVIADEAHRMGDAASQQTRAIRAATGEAPYRFALTGTPISDAPDDLFAILNWLYPEAYPSKTKFIDRFVEMSYNSWGGSQAIGIKQHMEQEFFAGLDPIMRRMPKEIILPFLPPVVNQRRDVEMSPKQKKAYEQMRDQMVAQLDDGELVITDSPLTKAKRMLQFASSYAEIEWREVIDKKTGLLVKKPFVRLTDPSCKLDAFMDDLDDFEGESVIVFHPSSQLINLLSSRLDKEKIRHGRIIGGIDSYERQQHMDDFQAGRTKFILCTTGAGGTGITLTRARIAAYLGRPYSNIESQQSEGRNHRIGSQIHETIIHRDYVTTGTIDEGVFEALHAKNIQLQSILRDKEILKKFLASGNIPEEAATLPPVAEEIEDDEDE